MNEIEKWEKAGLRFKLGDVISGIVRAKRPFGLFLELEGGHVGLIPIIVLGDTPQESDDLWLKSQVGDELKGIVVHVDDGEREIKMSRKSADYEFYRKTIS
jgi:ribosomal protein S1